MLLASSIQLEQLRSQKTIRVCDTTQYNRNKIQVCMQDAGIMQCNVIRQDKDKQGNYLPT